MTNNVKNYGLVIHEQQPEEYIFGASSIPDEIICPDGQYKIYAPEGEGQDLYVETNNCTGFGTLNPIEIILRIKYGVEENHSDRGLGIVAGTFPPGNSPHTVAEAIRKHGIFHEHLLPFDESINTVEEYYSPNPLPQKLIDAGKQFLDIYDFKHEWVFKTDLPLPEKQQKLKEALKRSPLGVSVYAWEKGPSGLYIKNGEDNHWTDLIGYVDGVYWLIYDSYPEDGVYFKELDWNYDFGMAKRYYVGKKVDDPKYYDVNEISPKKNWITQLLLAFKKLIWK